jgi:hypothetical protein
MSIALPARMETAIRRGRTIHGGPVRPAIAGAKDARNIGVVYVLGGNSTVLHDHDINIVTGAD